MQVSPRAEPAHIFTGSLSRLMLLLLAVGSFYQAYGCFTLLPGFAVTARFYLCSLLRLASSESHARRPLSPPVSLRELAPRTAAPERTLVGRGPRPQTSLLVQLGVDHELIAVHGKGGQQFRVLEEREGEGTSLPSDIGRCLPRAPGARHRRGAPRALSIKTGCSPRLWSNLLL